MKVLHSLLASSNFLYLALQLVTSQRYAENVIRCMKRKEVGLRIYFWPATFRPHLLVDWLPDKIQPQWGLTYWFVSNLLYLTRLVKSLQTEF